MDRTALLQQLRDKRIDLGSGKIMAERLGIPEGTLKAVLSRNFDNLSTIDRVLTRFVEEFLDGHFEGGTYTANILCPHVGTTIDYQQCQTRSSGPKPFSGAARIAWWTKCQTCQFKRS